MRIKRVSTMLSMLIIFVLLVSVVNACAKPATPETIVLRVTDHSPPAMDDPQSLVRFGTAVTELTGGRVQFEYYFGGSLASGTEALSAIEKGVADMGCVGFVYHPAKFPLASMFSAVPWGSADAEVYGRIQKKMFDELPELRNESLAYNQKLLWTGSGSSYEINTVKPAPTLADLKGLRLGAVGKYMPRWVEAAGASAVSNPFTERLMNMQTGVTDGHIFHADGVYRNKFYEVAPYLTIAELGCTTWAGFTINLNTWNKLPVDIQQIMLKVADEEGAYYGKYIADLLETEIQKMKAAGLTIYTMSEQDKAKWANAIPDFPAEWAKEMEGLGLPGWAQWDKFRVLCEKEGQKFPRRFGVR